MSLRIAVTAVYAVITVGAVFAVDAGEAAEERVEHSTPPLSAAEEAALEAHEEAGEGSWAWLLAPAVLSMGLYLPKKKLRVAAGALTLLAGVAGAGWMSWTGHLGGELVYTHGLGVPARGEVSAMQSTHEGSATPDRRSGERYEYDDDH